jgi:sec-independent protein translocase protein TatC
MTFFDHLNSLRRHLWISVAAALAGFAVSLFFFDDLIGILTAPLSAAAESTGGQLYLTTVYEGFLARIKISLIAGIVLTLPVHIYNALVFVFPALTPREKRIVSIVVISGFIFIVASLYYGYIFLIPFSVKFLTGDRIITEGASFLLGFTKNIFYIVQVFTALIVIFQLPLLMLLLISLRIVSVKTAFRGGRYIIVAAFILSAVLTPPDIVSQIMTALPLIFLYYIGLLTAGLFRLGER